MSESFSFVSGTPSNSVPLQADGSDHHIDVVAVFGRPANSKLFDTAINGSEDTGEDDNMG
jgi:hypothetical protein